MGDHFKVEVQDLDQLLKQLHDSQDEMRKALSALEGRRAEEHGQRGLGQRL